MMSRTPLLLALASILVLGLAVEIQARIAPETTTITWSLADWNLNTANNVPLLTLDNLVWQGAADGSAVRRLTGCAPCVGDPDVSELTTNVTPVTWTDWHLTITNGTIDAATARKVGGPDWTVTVAADGSGFDAFSTMPHAWISPDEALDIWFRYTPTGTDDVFIDEYPSTDYEYVPEPSSLLAIASAFSALGLGRIKRRLRGPAIKKVAHCAIVSIITLLVLQACAMSAVTVTWAGGSVDLTLINNPDASRESWWPQVWYGELPFSMTDLSTVTFTGTGNFNNASGKVVNVVRLKQVATNNTQKNWTDFHVKLNGGTFYKKWLIQSGWSASMTSSQFDFQAKNAAPVLPGGKFSDGIEFTVNTAANGDGSFTLGKWPTTVPEPTGVLALMTGLTSLLAFLVRRKA